MRLDTNGNRWPRSIGLAVLVATSALANFNGSPAIAADSILAVPVKTISANIHGVSDPDTGTHNPAPVEKVRQVIQNQDVDIALLQEVCTSNLARLRLDFPTWDWAIALQVDSSPRCPDDGGYGNVVGSRWPISGTRSYLLPCPQPSTQSPCNRDHTMACAYIAVPGHANKALRACSAHLVAGWEAVNNSVRLAQTEFIKNELGNDIAADTAVILGGDFNAQPHSGPMSSIYDLRVNNTFGSQGQFHEVHQLLLQGVGAERTPPNPSNYPIAKRTHHTFVGWNPSPTETLENKFDYVSYSENVTDGRPDAVSPMYAKVLRNPYSDHEVLLGEALVAFRK